jgi:hypothetical protein
LSPLVGVWNEVLIAQEGAYTDEKNKEKQWGDDAIKANPSGLHGCDLAVSGKCAECEKSSKQNRIGKDPLEDDLRNSIKEVFEDEIEWGLILDDEIHLL